MPGNMRLHTRPSNEFHTEDTPPSTRPSSAASSSSTPKRSTSMDSLHTNSSSDKPSGEEFIPTRLIRAAPKVNSNAMQFVKTGPANLHKSAKEQMKKAEVVKSLRKTSLQEEEEWQSSSPSANPTTLEESTDWQTNLDKWKNSRRKRNEDVLERVIEVKKYEKEEEFSRGRRKSKTFSEMREDKDKRGRKYNFVVHDTDNNDLSDLGLNSGKNDGSSSLSDAADDAEHKDLDNDNKDTKSDAGFCTGSDTGSDGVFAEDNISDTSSALGDKKDAHDSLLDSGLPINSKESLLMNEHISITSSESLSSPLNINEYTYDKAIEEYKMFAENSVKKRTPSLTSLSSNASFSKEDEKTSFRSQDLSRKFDDKSSYFNRELDRDVKPIVHEPRFMRRDRTLKIDINKRRSMFELRDIDSENSEQKQINRRSIDVSDKLKTKVMSFESVSESGKKTPLLLPTRDTKFKEKLASFSRRNNVSTSLPSNALRKKTPERDRNFYKKLQSFTRLESEESNKTFTKSSTTKSSPVKTASTRATFEQKLPSWRSPERKVSTETRAKTSSLRSGMPLRDRIASFENLSPAENSIREKSVSMECLIKNSFAEEFRPLNSSVSVLNLTRRTPSTPYMVIELDEPLEAEEICTKSKISREYSNSTTFERSSNKTEETISPTGPPPRATISSSTPRIPQSSLRRTSASPTRKSPSPSRVPSSPTKKTSVSSRSRSPSPSINKISVSPSALPNLNVSSTRSHPDLSTRIEQPDVTPVDTSMPSTKRVSSLPTRVPRTSSSSLAPNDLPPEVPKSPPPEIPMCPPPLYSNGYSSEDQRPTFEIQSMEMIDDFSHSENNVDESPLKEYGDDDIDEVIENYEHLSESVTGTELPQEHYYESTLNNMGSLPKDHLNKDLYEENMYERIHDDEPMYENIYEKVNEDVIMEPSDYPFDHQYQTLEEVKTEVESFTSPPLPPKNAISADIEVLDVTWTDESTSPVLPPSVPPPPPPLDEDDFEDGTDGEGAVPHFIPPSGSILEKEDRQARPKTSAKQELRKKMSDFLGTQPQVHEEITLKPPPDVNEILRQERVDERLIVQKQQNLSRDLPLLDFDPLMPQPYRPRYTWEDRMKADSAKPHDMDESCDHLDFQLKLEELEQEMVKHDREMLQRIKTNDPPEERTMEPIARIQTLPDSKINYELSNNVDLSQSDHFNQILEIERSFNSKSSKISVEQKYSNTTSNIPPPSQYGELPSVPTPQQVYSDLYYDDGNNSVVAPQPPPRQTYAPPQNGSPANLPIQEFYTAPVFNDQRSRASNLDYQENSLFEEDSKSLQGSQFRSDVSPPKDSQPRKQSILALSAIPKPRLTDNDSWIMKKKADAGKKDYNKHWLFQEAEQRRLEQQERISRVRPPLTASSSLNNLSNPIQTTPSYQNHFQNVKSNFNQSTNNYSSSVSNGSHSPSSIYSPSNVSNISPSPYASPNTPSPNLTKPPRSNLVSNSPSNFNANYTTNSAQPYNSNGSTNGSNNNWRKQTKTYQPEPTQPTNASKPLPESIISTLTQRVSNKNKNTLPSSKNPVYKSNYRDDNYHDYMNTEFSSSSNISLTIPQGGIAPQQQLSPAPEDHRLLSVSGKKKCSHCGEELGRGAAMIIESLRLFYHIPCFKCCVCGIQLGNGTSGADVRVRNHKLHCHNCYSNDEGMKFSKV